ncbi:MAG: hypothetical protein ACYTG1_11215 [Planctomycetota bacterium]|jgi:hypothetical protein
MTAAPPSPAPAVPPTRRRLAPLAALVGLALVLTVPVALTGRGGVSEALDQRAYHLPTIRGMAEQWPRVDLDDYPSATSPGFHLFHAALSVWVSDDETFLQVVNCVVGAALVGAVAWFAAGWTASGRAAALAAPVLASSYVLGGAIWLTTDNAALLFVVLALGLAVAPRLGPGRGLAAGLASAAAVGVRQIHLWTAAPVALAGLLAGPARRLAPGSLRDHPAGPPRASTTVVTCAAALLPVALLAWLVRLWGGLMPPAYRDMHDVGANPATIGFTLALVGGFGVFFLPVAWRQTRALRPADPVVLAVVAAALVATLLVPTAYDQAAGRWGGSLWSLVRLLPAPAGRSIVLPPAAVAGGLVLVVLGRAARDAGRGGAATILLLSAAGWILAQSFDSQCFQRYLEPFVLILLAWLAALAMPADAAARRPGAAAGPLALAAVNLALSGVSLYRVVLGAAP